jgi:simple sugar transport system ATP-binding protein
MLNITKKFPGIIDNDNITLQLKRGELTRFLAEKTRGQSTLMSVLMASITRDGVIKKNGELVRIRNPNDANALASYCTALYALHNLRSPSLGLGVETTKKGSAHGRSAQKVMALSEQYGLAIDQTQVRGHIRRYAAAR